MHLQQHTLGRSRALQMQSNLFPDNRLRHSLSRVANRIRSGLVGDPCPASRSVKCDCQMFPINIGKTSFVAGVKSMSPLEFPAVGNWPVVRRVGVCAARTGQTPARATCHDAPARTGHDDRLHNSRRLRTAFRPVRGRYRLRTLKRYGVGQGRPRTSI